MLDFCLVVIIVGESIVDLREGEVGEFLEQFLRGHALFEHIVDH